jgi:hypothetical protein
MFRPERLEHHTVPDQEVDAIRPNRVLHDETDFRLHQPMANHRLERALGQGGTQCEQRTKVAGEPAVELPKIGVAEESLALDRVEQSERPLGGLALQVIRDHVEDGYGCSIRRKF